MGVRLPPLVATLVLLLGCGNDEVENQLRASQAEAEQQSALRRQAETRAAGAERRASEAEALVNEFRAQGSPINSLALFVDVQAERAAGSDATTARGVLTSVRLGTDDDEWTVYTSPLLPPTIRTDVEGKYTVTFRFEPRGDPSLIGEDVTELGRIKTLESRFSAVLPSMNLLATEAGITRLRLVMNGVTVLDVQNLGTTQAVDGRAQFPVHEHFSQVPEAYSAALVQRAAERSAQ